MSKQSNSLDQSMFNKLQRLYSIALITIAVSVIVSQILIHSHLNSQKNDSTVINIAGRQRMLSQKLAKDVILLSTATHLATKEHLKNEIKSTLALWELSHYALQKGNDSLGLPKKNSATIEAKFAVLNPVFQTISSASKAIVNKLERAPLSPIQTYIENVEQVKASEHKFLTMMDAIVHQYNIEADKKLAWLSKLELWLTALTLLVLLGEFLFIFLPISKLVKTTLSNVLLAEKQAKKMAFNADELSRSKEKSIRALKAFGQAMDDTLLFARITPSGNILHMGNKFLRLFKVAEFSKSKTLWEVLSHIESEQSTIESLIYKAKKEGWQGELKVTAKAGKTIWLEMSITPYNPIDENAELLIIASEITQRKIGQLEIDRLTNESFEEKINQQKIISSKIIENQEKEQNRIAKDVHDGIGQMLTGLKYNLESIDTKNVTKATDKIEHLKALTTDIIKGVRTATFNLTPPELSDHGIVPAITKLTQELTKLTGKNIVFFNKTDFNHRLESLTEINIYRITQEAINNAIKYAESTHILVSLSHSKHILSIVIDDNGKGFDPEKNKTIKNADGGMGMAFMRERIKYINGRLFLNSELGVGTRITLNIPID